MNENVNLMFEQCDFGDDIARIFVKFVAESEMYRIVNISKSGRIIEYTMNKIIY